ncbi:unnamed protein product, partial [Diamesa serratosioi]
KIDDKWNNILNPPVCASIYKDYHQSICENKNFAVLIPDTDFIDSKINCTVMELSGPDYVPSSYGSLLISSTKTGHIKFEAELLIAFTNHYGLKTKLETFEKTIDAYLSILSNNSDICLHPVGPRSMEDTLLPHFQTDYAIYYKIKDFNVSSTFFLEGLTFELWMYCVVTFIGLFLGFMILSRAYNHYLKLKNSSCKIVLYQANFICNQAVSDYLDKFLSWRILKIDVKWEGVLNPPVCASIYKDYHKSICEFENFAALIPDTDFIDSKINCTVMELSGPDYVKSSDSALLVNLGFKYKEHANRFYLRMREVGVVKRLSRKYKTKKDPLINFQNHYNKRYVVEQDGVMFEHVKLIVLSYFAFLPIPLIVLLMEILIHKYKTRKSN